MTKRRLAFAGLALGAVAVAAGGAPADEDSPSENLERTAAAPISSGAAPEVKDEELASFLEPCSERLNALERRKYRTRTLVAILPDPVDSHYHREFDLLLTAVRRALEHPDRGFLQDRHCLPWRAAAQESGEGPAFHRSLPGVILFRKDPRVPTDSAEARGAAESRELGEVLVLFLVGEVPAWGVQTRALRVALDFAVEHALEPDGAGERSDRSVVAILGPTFSGSTRSLGVALAGWRDQRLQEGAPKPSFEIVSGSATSPGNPDVLKEVLGGGFSYRSAATDDNRLQDCLWNFFVPDRLGLQTRYAPDSSGEDRTRKSDNGAVALLVESSLYGRGFDLEGFHVLPFPMHISQLRAEHEKQRRRRLGGGQAKLDLAPELPVLELQMEDHHPTLDQLPVFDPEGTSRTQDLVLVNILTTISRNRIEVAGIVASNTMDKLFLARILRSYAPDVRLVTFEGDLLLTHPQFTSATLGMLVVSSSPLTDPDPSSPASGIRLQFATDTAQGVYKATRMLVEDHGPPHEVWLSTVGRSSLIPLERIVFSEDETRSCREIAEAERVAASPPGVDQPGVPPPRGWALVLSLASLLILFTLYEVVRRDRFLGIDWRQFAPWPISRAGSCTAAPVVHGLIVLIPVAAAVPYLLLSGPYLRYLAARAEVMTAATLLVPTSWDEGLFLLVLTCPVALGLTAGVLLSGLAQRTWIDLHALRNRWSSEEPEGAAESGTRARGGLLGFGGSLLRMVGAALPFLVTLAGILAAGLAIQRGFALFGSPGPWLTLLLQRSITLGSGVSPLLPVLLLLLVPVGWVLSTLWRHRTLDELPPCSEDSPEAGPESSGEGEAMTAKGEAVSRATGDLTGELRCAIAEVRRAVNPATFWLRAHPLLWCLIVLIPVLYLSFFYAGRRGPLLRGIEATAFDWSVSVLFLAAVVLLLGSALSLHRGWSALRRWLQLVRTIRLNPGAGYGGDTSLWLEKLRQASEVSRRDREELRALRSEALETFRGRLAAEIEAGASAPVRTLHRRIEQASGQGSERTRHLEVWMALLEWTGQGAACPPKAATPDGLGEQPMDEGEPELVSRARELFVWQTGYLTRVALAQLGQLMAFLMGGLLVLFLAVSTYPFEPQRVLTLYVSGLTLLGVLFTATILWQMERDNLIHKLSATGKGLFGRYRGLLGRLALFVGLPLFSVLASQIPGMRRALLQWLDPVLKSLL